MSNEGDSKIRHSSCNSAYHRKEKRHVTFSENIWCLPVKNGRSRRQRQARTNYWIDGHRSWTVGMHQRNKNRAQDKGDKIDDRHDCGLTVDLVILGAKRKRLKQWMKPRNVGKDRGHKLDYEYLARVACLGFAGSISRGKCSVWRSENIANS
jgi:hypothetical protein